jgi:hypothetical protein
MYNLTDVVLFPQMIILPGETMSIDDEMTIDERRKYLRKRQKQYAKADRIEKGKLLDEMEQAPPQATR